MTHTRTIGLALARRPGSAGRPRWPADYPPPAKPSTTAEAAQGPVPHAHGRASKGCKYRTIQSAVEQGEGRRHGQGQERHLPRGRDGARRRPSATSSSSATPSDPSKVVLDGSQGKKAPRQNGVRVDGANQVTINGFTAKHYNGNGFFVVNVTGYTLNHLNATLAGVYGIYAFNSIGGTMENSEASCNNDSGFYIGQTPKQTKPDALDRPQRQVVRQRPRLLGHQHALRDDHEVAVVQQRHRHRPQRARHREVRAAGGQRHHRQRHLLEQLQLLRGRAVQAARSRRRARRTRSASASCSSAAAAPRSATTAIYGNYLVGVGRAQADPAQAGRRRGPRSATRSTTTVRARRRRPQRPRAVLRRQRHRQLLRAQRRRDERRPRPTARRSRRARSRAPTRSTRRPRTRRSTGASAIPTHEAYWIRHPHAAKAGLTPLEHYKK